MTAAASPPVLLPWARRYNKEWLRPDVVAGLTAAAVVIPKAMAYATVAGLPVQVGLYTAFIPMLLYAALGTSSVLSVSTTSTLAILTGTSLAAAVPDGNPAAMASAVATLALLVGAMLVVAAVFRLGFVANFISEPVLIGFKAAVGVIIIADQVPKLLGFHGSGKTFVQKLVATGAHVPSTSLPTLALAVVTIALLVGMEKFLPRVPAPLVAVAGGIAAAAFLGLGQRGIELVGRVPTGLPPFAMPDLSLIAVLWPGAVGIALMSFTETVAAGRAFARSDDPPIQPNRELLATGLANGAGAFFGAMPAGGGTSQTAVTRRAGARTQLSKVVNAAVTLATMLVLARLIGLMPQATLAAVVVVYSVGLIQPREFRAILEVRRTEFIWALAAFGGVMLLGTLRGIVVAIILSLVALASQVADPPVYVLGRKRGTNVFRPLTDEHPDDETFPGLVLVKLEGRVFFANAERIGQKLRAVMAERQPKVLVVDLSAVFDLEYTALKMLTEGEKRGREDGIELWIAGLNPAVLSMLQRSPLGETLGRNRMAFNLETAVARYEAEAGTVAASAG